MHSHEHSAHAPHDGHDQNHDHDHGGTGKYIAVFFALCILTTASILTTLPWWRTHVPYSVSCAIMMTVSCVKAMLVIMFFMHLIWEANWKWVLTIPAACMSLFLVLMLIPDIGLRTRNYDRPRWNSAAYPTSTQPAHSAGTHEEHEHAPAPAAAEHAH